MLKYLKFLFPYTFEKYERILQSKNFRILFVGPAPHHAVHLEPIIDALSAYENIDIVLVGPFKPRPGIMIFEQIDQLLRLPQFDLAISTEFRRIPPRICQNKVFFGHGVGPKLNYQSRNELSMFQYSFAPCTPIFQAHCAKGTEVYKVGLPFLDRLFKEAVRSDSQVKKVIYAPSWCNQVEFISDVDLIASRLAQLSENFDVTISPHPNLLDPKKCGGKQFFSETKLRFNDLESGKATIELCAQADIVISDISSILYESLALGKDVYFDGNRNIYEYCEAQDVYQLMVRHVPTLDWTTSLESQLNIKYPKNKNYINDYLFNIGNASQAFVRAIATILNKKEQH